MPPWGALPATRTGGCLAQQHLACQAASSHDICRPAEPVPANRLHGLEELIERFEHERFLADDLIEICDGGEIAITGRASDLINTASKKVNPREVEQVLLQIDGVLQAKVYGEPAGARGEVVAAAVVATPDVTREQIRAWCRDHLSPHKVPRIIKLIESIPVDERGKVKRAALAEL
jgi:acyl-coenzyme A synthetase/AMP-(fatty) acid ligase